MIDILLASYNGEKFIKSQILSLLSQTYENWRLIIHDDGSTDKTIDIIKEFQKIDSRIVLIEDGVKCGGVGANFLYLLKNYGISEYVIFCDQDDIWLENKIEELVKLAVDKNCENIPVLVYCDGYSFSNHNEINQESISRNHASELQDFLFFNGGYQGCSIIMNKKLVDLANNYNGIVYHHDDLVSLIAHTFGQVYFLPKKLMLYRQHDKAVTGNKNFKNTNIFNNAGFVVSRKHYEVKKDFFRLNKNILSEDKKNIFTEYFDVCESNSKIYRIFLLLKNSFTYGGSKSKLIFKIIFQDIFSK